MKKYIFVCCVLSLIVLSCSSFVKEKYVGEITLLEKGTYTVVDDISIGGKSLKKGDVVRIIVTYDNDWVKAEAYLASMGKLKGERVRLLFMFEDDFPDKKFDPELFKNRLFRAVSLKK